MHYETYDVCCVIDSPVLYEMKIRTTTSVLVFTEMDSVYFVALLFKETQNYKHVVGTKSDFQYEEICRR